MRYCEKCRNKYKLNIIGLTSGAYCDLCGNKKDCYNVLEHVAKKRTIYHVNDEKVTTSYFRKTKFGVYPQTQLHGNIITNKYNRTEHRYGMFFKDNGESYKWISHDEFLMFSKNAKHEYVEPDVVLKDSSKVVDESFEKSWPYITYIKPTIVTLKKPKERWEVLLKKYNTMLEDGKIDLNEYKVLVNSI